MDKAAKKAEGGSHKEKLSILLVEDSEDDYLITRWLINQVFDDANLNLVWEKNYDGALSAVQRDLYDVILLDVNLGGRDGLELAKELGPHVADTPPIIVLTGGDSIKLELKAIRLGASDCLFKNQLTAPLLERAINYSIVRKETEKKLLLNEVRYRAILETANDGIITLDDEGIITSYNPAAEKLFGYSPSEIIGENILILMPKHIAVKHNAYLREYLATDIQRIIGTSREVQGVRKDGSEFPLYLSVADVGIPGPYRFSGILRDLTLEKEAKETILEHNVKLEHDVLLRTIELKIAKEMAEKADNAKTEFLANISHEIRTPLYGILSFANMGSDRALSHSPEKSKEYFDHIKSSGNRLLGLMNDLLDLSKLESNKNAMSFDSEDIKTLTEQCFQSEKARLEEKKITWKIYLGTEKMPVSGLNKVQCNNDGIRRVISNLLSNAIRFSPVSGHIKVELTELEGTPLLFCFKIFDEGVGIPEDETETIFDKFIQSSKTNTGAGGTGLGLSICKEIIDIHRGRIRAENREGRGAVFIFEIPSKHLTSE